MFFKKIIKTMKNFLAIDIGASSGRHIIGRLEDGEIKTKEVYRFKNGVENEGGRLVWNIKELYKNVLAGIKKAFSEYGKIESLAIDTWGCDYVLLSGDREILPCYAYRDNHNQDVIAKVYSIIPFFELYKRTGIQYQPFNTLYRLFCDKESGRLESATDFLMIPEYLAYLLTGVKKKEYTNATTTGLINAESGGWDKDIISRLNLPEGLFKPLNKPKTYVGRLLPNIEKEVGGNLKVILCASHDTASAVEGIPMDGDELYISSGTWSLLGVKLKKPLTDDKSRKANYTNEGGVGYIRYQKNIMGMWIINRLRDELCPEKDFSGIVKEAEESNFNFTVDINAEEFLSPVSMKSAFDIALKEKPKSDSDYFRSAYLSLAESYGKAVTEIESNTGRKYNKIYIVGGGAKNNFLNVLTERATGKEIIALPIEATAMGNIKMQEEFFNGKSL